MTTETRFIEPLDVLFLRGNKLFGDPGSYGESLVPPWPSVAAGALRSRMLADDGVDFAAFAGNTVNHPTLGTPSNPGSFTITAFLLARRFADGRVEAVVAPPADLVINDEGQSPVVRRLTPTSVADGISASSPLPLLPVLAEARRGKPADGYWLVESGWKKYLASDTPTASDLVKSSALWAIDPRVGVGLDSSTRRAADGKLFSVQAVAMVKRGHQTGTARTPAEYDVGFLAAISGAIPPSGGMLRLGGDGRAAALHVATVALPEADYAAVARSGRCRIVLTTPGIFAGGWQPPGSSSEARVRLHGVSGRLLCAAVPRAKTVSGWDLARHQPKPAQRVAPAGSVYWLDEVDTTPEALRKLVETGLWGDPCEDAARRAEGFNRIAIAAY